MTERRTFLQRLFGGPSKQPAEQSIHQSVAAAVKAQAPAAARAASSPIWPSLGVLFDIENLGTTDYERMFYGQQARRIFMTHFKPRAVGRAYLWHGDTQSTLDGGRGRRFCIAVTASSQAALDAVRTAFARAGDKGLAPVAERFSERPVDLDFSAGAPKPVRREPLPLWLSIDDNFTAVLATSEREDVELCKEFNWPYRVG